MYLAPSILQSLQTDMQKQDSYFSTIRCKDLFGAHTAQMALNNTLEKRIKPDCIRKLAPRCLFGIDYLLFFLEGPVHKVGFYTCIMKLFQPVCICVGETNKDDYCQQIPFYPPCHVCLWRINVLTPEPVGLLGQSALSFMLFIYTMQQNNSPILISLRGLAIPRPLKQSSIFQAHHPDSKGGAGWWKEKRWGGTDSSSGRVQIKFHINVCKFPHSC